MSKTATIRTRIEPRLKSEVEDILAQLGLTASETVHLLYRQIKLQRGLPFDVRIPNPLTARTLNASKAGKGVKRFDSKKALFADLDVRTFSRTSQFKKDVKRAGRRGKDLAQLKAALELLNEGGPLPAEFRDHPLRGNFAGSRDCHIEPDWVLIYTLSEKDTHVCFERTGTHSDLFR